MSKDNVPRVTIKGYAVAPDIPHEYMVQKDSSGKVIKSFKSLFTPKFVNSIVNQMKYKPVFVDALHQTAANINIRSNLEHMQKQAQLTGQNFEKEIESIMSNLKVSQMPLGKPTNFGIDDAGMFVEVELNPAFREYDEDHKHYYDSVVKSLQNGNLNTMSINFQATETFNDDGIEKIDDGKFYGISFMSDGALGAHSNITEVAIRSIMEVRSTMPTEETKPTETVQPKKSEKDYEEEYFRVQAELQAIQAEQEKQKQAAEFAKQKEDLKRELLETIKNEVQAKGEVTQRDTSQQTQESTIKSRDEWIESVKGLSWKDKIQLQHELNAVGNELARNMGILKKDSDMDFNIK